MIRHDRRPPRTASVGAVYLAVSWLAFALSILVPAAAYAQAEGTREYQVKAAFLFNFGQFVTWSPQACPDSDAPFVIGILGEDRFGATLDDLIRGERINDRPAIVERYESVDEIGTCQILFISASENARLDAIFATLADRSVLTVGEVPNFADRRGVILLDVVDNRMRLEINTAAAAAANLSISSKLLRLADVVRTEGS